VRDFAVLFIAGALGGAGVGAYAPFRGQLPLMWGALGGVFAFGAFAFAGEGLSRVCGRSLGWAAGGPIGLCPGGAVWFSLIADARYFDPKCPVSVTLIGGFTGLMAGTICGSFLGAVALRDEVKAKLYQGRSDQLGMTIGILMLEFLFGVYLFTAFFVIQPLY
jgi:hypothetical protein